MQMVFEKYKQAKNVIKKEDCVRTCEYCFINAFAYLFHMFRWVALKDKKEKIAMIDEIRCGDFYEN